MSSKITNDDSCDDCDSSSAQAALAPFLRPTITANDKDWAKVARLSYQQKKYIIEQATTTKIPPDMPDAGGAVSDDDRDAANAFGTAMLAALGEYPRDELEWEYYCAAVNFLAFAKWSDLHAFERIDAGDFVGEEELDAQCQKMLDAAAGLGMISLAPTFYILKSPTIEIRIFPYTPLIAIFINPKRPLNDPDGEIQDFDNLYATISHEVAHYLFWYAQKDGISIEAWARSAIAAIDNMNDTKKGEAYRFLEELFCDAVGVAAGGVKCAQALIEAIGMVLKNAEGDYWRVRLISILKGVKKYYGDEVYEDHKRRANRFIEMHKEGEPLITDEDVRLPSAPYLLRLWDEDMQKYLQAYHDATQGISDIAVVTRNEFTRPQVEPQRDLADLVQEFKDQWASAPPLGLFPYEWFGVLQALGWGNRPTKNNIGTQRGPQLVTVVTVDPTQPDPV